MTWVIVAGADKEALKETEDISGRKHIKGYSCAFVTVGLKAFMSEEKIIFQTITSSGPKDQRDTYGAYFVSRELAEDALAREINLFIVSRVGAVHWRQEPMALSKVFYETDFPTSTDKITLKPVTLWVAVARLAVHPFVP